MKNTLKIHKILAYIFGLTIISLVYVNQHVLIYQMGLRVKDNTEIYSKLVDRNRLLVYNTLDLKSPINLETKLLAEKVELNMPRKWQIVRLEDSPKKIVQKHVDKKGFFANLFSVGRVAEASQNQ